MPDKFLLSLLNILFFSPVLLVLFKKRETIKPYKGLVLFGAFLGLIAYFIGETLFMYWKAYWYDFDKTLGIRIGDSVLEILIWSILVPTVVAVVVVSCAEREEKKESIFTSFFKF